MFRLASVLLLVLFTYQFIAQGADASSSSITPREEKPPSCRPQRTLHDIIWGCVSTTIICTWIALHPHIPPREGPFKSALRRLELLFWTVLAPETLPACALNQRLAAKSIIDWYNNKRDFDDESCGIWQTLKGWFSLYEIKRAEKKAWTLKHGHFLIMGGIRLVEPPSTPSAEGTNADAEKGPDLNPEGGRETILTFEMLQELTKDPEFMVRITENEIAERSKGDALSKIIFLSQTSWFMLQCLARRIQGLDISQLELTTVALASVNAATFILWWEKPLGLQAVVRVYLKRKLTDVERKVEGRGQSARSKIIPDLQACFEKRVAAPIRKISLPQPKLVDWVIGLPCAISTLLAFPILAFATATIYNLGDVALEGAASFPADATHVPTIYCPKHKSKYLHTILLTVLASIFGGLHCAGWNSYFPNYAEQTLWRVTSLTTATLPFVLIFVLFASIRLNPKVEVEDNIIAYPAFLIFTFLWVTARGILLGQAITLLRQPPQNTFTIITWTRFYPHIF